MTKRRPINTVRWRVRWGFGETIFKTSHLAVAFVATISDYWDEHSYAIDEIRSTTFLLTSGNKITHNLFGRDFGHEKILAEKFSGKRNRKQEVEK